MARLGIFAIVVLVIGFFAYIDINAYKLGFAPPSQRLRESSPHVSIVSPHQAYRQAPMQAPTAGFGTPNVYFGGTAHNSPSFKAEFGQPRDAY